MESMNVEWNLFISLASLISCAIGLSQFTNQFWVKLGSQFSLSVGTQHLFDQTLALQIVQPRCLHLSVV